MGDMLYRYENHVVSLGVDQWDEPIGSRTELYCMEFMVEHVTPRGCKIMAHNREGNWTLRPVMDHYVNKFAYPTKVEALLGFIARKKRQQAILFGQFSRSREAENKAVQLLSKEM